MCVQERWGGTGVWVDGTSENVRREGPTLSSGGSTSWQHANCPPKYVATQPSASGKEAGRLFFHFQHIMNRHPFIRYSKNVMMATSGSLTVFSNNELGRTAAELPGLQSRPAARPASRPPGGEGAGSGGSCPLLSLLQSSSYIKVKLPSLSCPVSNSAFQ